MIISSTGYWLFFGTVALIFLTYQDFKNNMIVDDRRNYFMMGVTISLCSHFSFNIVYLLSLIICAMLVNLLMSKTGVLGGADVNSLTWIYLGFGFINFAYLLWFFVIFFCILIFHFFVGGFMAKIFKKDSFVTPGYLLILLSFLLTGLLFKLY